MTKTLETRVAALEGAARKQGEGWQPFTQPTDAEWTEYLAGLGISTTPQEAAGKGYSCVMEEIAAKFGLTLRELKAQAQEYEAAHEWKWIHGRCYIRERGRP